MNWEEIAITTFLTALAGASAALVSIWYRETLNRKRTLRALCSEIEINIDSAKSNIEIWESDTDISLLFPFRDVVFRKILESGELGNMSSEVFRGLDYAYSYIDRFNRAMERGKFTMESPTIMCGEIHDNLLGVKESLCQKT